MEPTSANAVTFAQEPNATGLIINRSPSTYLVNSQRLPREVHRLPLPTIFLQESSYFESPTLTKAGCKCREGAEWNKDDRLLGGTG